MTAVAVEGRVANQSRARVRRAARTGAVRPGGAPKGRVQVRPGVAPKLRPVRPGRGVARAAVVPSRGCQVSASRPAARVVTRPVARVGDERVAVRLTDRGIAVVLALFALVMCAAVLCVGVTAFQVMADPVVAGVVR